MMAKMMKRKVRVRQKTHVEERKFPLRLEQAPF